MCASLLIWNFFPFDESWTPSVIWFWLFYLLMICCHADIYNFKCKHKAGIIAFKFKCFIGFIYCPIDENLYWKSIVHDDVIKWKQFPRYWPFVQGIHRWPVNSPHKGQSCGSFDVFFDLRLNKRLSKPSWGRWFEMPSRSLWCHCNVCSWPPVW